VVVHSPDQLTLAMSALRWRLRPYRAIGNVGPVFDWCQNGDVEVPLPGYGLTLQLTPASAALM
jgi:hypothetical protein